MYRVHTDFQGSYSWCPMWWLWHVARDLAFIENVTLNKLCILLSPSCNQELLQGWDPMFSFSYPHHSAHTCLLLNLVLAVLGLRCCAWAFSSCSKQGAPLHCCVQTFHCRDFSRHPGSVVVDRGLVALQHVGSSWTRYRTHVPCTSRWVLYH